jgi:putative transposase
MLQHAVELSGLVGPSAASAALGVSRATLHRARRPRPVREPRPRPRPHRRIPDDERARIVALLNEDRFYDLAPAEVWARLLDEEGVFPCSVRTLYRLLAERGLVRERRAIARHPVHPCPELVARGPNEVWSWDITKLRGQAAGVWYFLYVILDIFSRYVVAWMVAASESGELARKLIEEAYARHGVSPGQLQLHSDRGSPMTSRTLAQKLADLQIERSLSRPRVSNDNPFSEAQFKTVKYHPSFPGRFGSVESAREHFGTFFPWYVDEHRHAGLALLTPADVHYGRAGTVLSKRQLALDAAFAAHAERFPHGPPRIARPPSEVWINKPTGKILSTTTEVITH